jgi:uncharacterized membrane protein
MLPVASIAVANSALRLIRPLMMVSSDRPRARNVHFVIRPNRSLSWRGNQLFFIFIFAISFGVAGIFAAQGMWLMLPFAGLEMLVLGLALYQCALRSCWQEVITIQGQRVCIAMGRDRPERSCTFDRSWAKVVLDQPEIRGHPSRLWIRSHGRQVEVGACLVDEERQRLAAALREALREDDVAATEEGLQLAG